ncbi:MAG: 2-phosphosulfolactate phosphatase [Bacteroidetes bacterium]|nr:2-phosphosulfolactate phosphatase [Bacteroidota bacterium]MDA1121921.1 2-phosphosulfolactate phosphatase [Bacteroidota bacterium]
MPSLEVCLTPELIHLYPADGKIVVVTDILRATSCMVTALSEGIESITPVSTTTECRELQKLGYLAAAERNGEQVEGFDLGNSPLSYLENNFTGRKLAMTTTNGTLAINKSKNASELLIGAFLNLSVLSDYLKACHHDLLIVCAGWKGMVSYEDTLFAGALATKLGNSFEIGCDSAMLSIEQYANTNDDLLSAIKKSSHYKRLHNLKISKDIEFCIDVDRYALIPRLDHNQLVSL